MLFALLATICCSEQTEHPGLLEETGRTFVPLPQGAGAVRDAGAANTGGGAGPLTPLPTATSAVPPTLGIPGFPGGTSVVGGAGEVSGTVSPGGGPGSALPDGGFSPQ